ncbi:MAG TPA: HAD-IC family P-type ATPase [Rhodothermales bacterium]|nr:HAD-IC family P-type ATPase [Rhodothermales bacterium]
MATVEIEVRREEWHGQDADAVLQTLESGPTGLTTDEARRRRERYGPNVLPRASGTSPLKLFLGQVNDPLLYVLLGSGFLALVMGKVVDGIVVLGVVVLNAIIGFIQEFRAGKAIEALVDLVPYDAVVIRDDLQVTLPAEELVPGDVVLLQSGDKVPADMRLLTARGLRIDEAALTGESVPVDKGPAPVALHASLGDRLSMAYSGTLVTSGTATAAVVETGSRTELGRISSLLSQTSKLETPLTRQMAKVAKLLTVVIGVVALLLLGVGLLRGYGIVDAVLAAITLAVAAIPEGLPAIITIALAIGVQRMAGRRAVIRKLPAVETLGSTTIICSDKTGTLTRGEMTVQALWTPGSGRFDVTGVGYAPDGDLVWQSKPVREVPGEVEELLKAGALCNDSSLFEDGTIWQVSGDPTEGALIVAAEKAGVNVIEARQKWTRLDAIPFESERQFMATLHEAEGYHPTIYLKGAPEVVVRRCEMQAHNTLYFSFVLDQVSELAAEGLRVLAVASKRLETPPAELTEEDVAGGFTLLGFEAMIDPPRPEAIESIRICHRAGIDVKMITGDHGATAESVGRQLGLVGHGERVYTGSQIEHMSDEELKEAVEVCGVFARVAPEHKLRLVRSLQADGEVVAMTGDGVNDAPALKQADIGVAMGISGTAVAKESADMVLTNDNFASIEAAVEEGRRVYDNLIKSLAFVLPTNIGEALIILLAVLFFPITHVAGEMRILMPMLPVQILWINLVATVTLALPLAFEAMEPGVMLRPPRRPDTPILGGFVLFRTIVVAVLLTAGAVALFLYEYNLELDQNTGGGLALMRAQTVAVTTVILFQIFYLLQCRSLKASVLKIGLWTNPWVYVGIVALLAMQAAFVYLPFMNKLFSSVPLEADAWVRATVVALAVLPVISIEKWWRHRQDVHARHSARHHGHVTRPPAGDVLAAGENGQEKAATSGVVRP